MSEKYSREQLEDAVRKFDAMLFGFGSDLSDGSNERNHGYLPPLPVHDTEGWHLWDKACGYELAEASLESDEAAVVRWALQQRAVCMGVETLEPMRVVEVPSVEGDDTAVWFADRG